MAKKSTFIRQFFKERKMIGSVSPSSRFLTEKMMNNIDFKKAKIIIELGPGTGVFTKRMLELMSDDAKLFSFELNEKFYNILKEEINDNRLILINDTAEKIQEYLNEQGFLNADYVVSSLPLTNFPNKIRNIIIDASYLILKNQGKYIQFQYSTLLKKNLQKKYQSIHTSFTPLNFPPAFVFTCIKEK